MGGVIQKAQKRSPKRDCRGTARTSEKKTKKCREGRDYSKVVFGTNEQQLLT